MKFKILLGASLLAVVASTGLRPRGAFFVCERFTSL
jgi:hypothetical protein